MKGHRARVKAKGMGKKAAKKMAMMPPDPMNLLMPAGDQNRVARKKVRNY